ncbi:2-amino-4-hydroxy-6-hydroxymethyldihydropteridine diphosphokinase [Marinobacter sp. NP-4(2019)]|uniref:2-amino-4-hydroxy-6- hydroxymethyldihydropteridine diphosphokinase n=1 Tax=Marinobacter sp. NP-4(2019) TaxID=2488665 RepID=UPI000FC3CE96|nr:2-amino-4-hydroxy-6-hydroxymethyldihydropteridine diphosphokinase [Marinobacter sp. NP-4(2019)]AZT82713.1 2-amino-4-hydroxy-6-hydroxymethyldihydropteridine diphosphokinase [Marinobacter sp. NP-4(2019)]
MSARARVYISIGSNTNRSHYVTVALDALSEWFGVLTISPVYESEAVGFDGSPFYNLVVGVDTDWSVGELSRRFKQLEADNGRRRDEPRFRAQTLDLDILTYNGVVGETDGVELPRGEILRNAFVLWPLSDIAPDDRHPVCGKTYRELWRSYSGDQKLWPIDFTWQGKRISRAL